MDTRSAVLYVAVALLVIDVPFSLAEYLDIKPSLNNDGFITSPNYPFYYDSGKCFVWRYQGKPGLGIKINFMDMDIPTDTDSCSDDYLKIGPFHEQIYCGSTLSRRFEPYEAKMVTGEDRLYVTFCSSYSGRKARGFKIYYQFTDLGDVPSAIITSTSATSTSDLQYAKESWKADEDDCDFEITSMTGEITTNTRVLNCIEAYGRASWLLHYPDSYFRYKIQFEQCYLAYEGVLSVYNGITKNSALLSSYESGGCPKYFLSSHNGVFIEYQNQRRYLQPRFTLYFEMISSIPPAAEMSTVRTSTTENPAYHSFDKCGLSFTERFGVISSYSMYSTLQKSAVCTWLLHGQQVTFSITVQKFHMSPSSIFTISDGSDRFARILFGGHNVQDTASITFESSQSSVFIYYYNPQIYDRYRDTSDSFIIKYFKQENPCPTNYRACGYGENDCYKIYDRCDGIQNCPLHGGDERGCSSKCPGEFSCDSTEYGSIEYGNTEYTCYNETDRCNGKGSCSDFADEAGCSEKQCSSDKGLFLCKNKRCIYESWTCDGRRDCSDGSDETGCSVSSSPRIVIAAVVSCISCGLLLVIVTGCVCKAHNMHFNRLHRGAHNETPLSRQLAEMFNRRAPPPPYHEAMLTSRPYSDVHQELSGVVNDGYQDSADQTLTSEQAPHGARQDGRSSRHSPWDLSENQISSQERMAELGGMWDFGTLHLFPEGDLPLHYTVGSDATGDTEGLPYNETDHPLRVAAHHRGSSVEPDHDEAWQEGDLNSYHPLIQFEVMSPGARQSPAGDERFTCSVSFSRSDSSERRPFLQGHHQGGPNGGSFDEDDRPASTSLPDVSNVLEVQQEGKGDKTRENLSVLDEDSDTDCILAANNDDDDDAADDDSSYSDSLCILHHMR